MTGPTSSLTGDQVDEYFARINLPKQYARDKNPALDLAFLSALQAYHLTAIPYENLSLHYLKDVKIDLDVSEIHAKLVQRRRGGYCMENNILIYHVLLFLGFPVYLTGARLYRGTDGKFSGWSGWEHSVNLVTLPDQSRYLVDVGYGGHGPKAPLTVIDGSTIENIGTQSVRLIRGNLPGSQQDVWMYQFRNADDQSWTPGYAFTEIEFFFADFEVMNFFTSRSRDCFLTTKLLVVMFLREGDQIYGKLVLDHHKVKKNAGGKNEMIEECNTEKERIQALQHHFGIELTEDEKSGIRGKISELV